MSTTERELDRERVRERILDAARDIVGEEGLDALSMRALAERAGVSPAALYLHFADKDELLRGVMAEGYARLEREVGAEMMSLDPDRPVLDRLAATARAYARFALENTGYFRAMFEVPGVARIEGCPEPGDGAEDSMAAAESLLRQAESSGEVRVGDPSRAALIGWGLMHGLTSLYLSGHLADHVETNEDFMDLVDGAIAALRAGWKAD